MPGARDRARGLLDRLLPHGNGGEEQAETLESLLAANGFDPIQHERIQAELRAGHIGVAQNRLPATVQIEDVAPEQLFDARHEVDAKFRKLGEEALAAGAVAVVTLSGGAGSRWTQAQEW